MSEECYETITTLTLQDSFSFDTPLSEVLEQLTRDARAYGYELDRFLCWFADDMMIEIMWKAVRHEVVYESEVRDFARDREESRLKLLGITGDDYYSMGVEVNKL